MVAYVRARGVEHATATITAQSASRFAVNPRMLSGVGTRSHRQVTTLTPPGALRWGRG